MRCNEKQHEEHRDRHGVWCCGCPFQHALVYILSCQLTAFLQWKGGEILRKWRKGQNRKRSGPQGSITSIKWNHRNYASFGLMIDFGINNLQSKTEQFNQRFLCVYCLWTPWCSHFVLCRHRCFRLKVLPDCPIVAYWIGHGRYWNRYSRAKTCNN